MEILRAALEPLPTRVIDAIARARIRSTLPHHHARNSTRRKLNKLFAAWARSGSIAKHLVGQRT